MNEGNVSLLEDQSRLARYLKFLIMLFGFGNKRLLELTPDWVNEYSPEIYSLSKQRPFSIHRYWHEEFSPDHQIVFIDHLLMTVVWASEKTCSSTHISDWLRNDSFAAWQFCILETELNRLYESLIKRISFGHFGAIESVEPVYGGMPRGDFRAEVERIINDSEFGFGDLKEEVDFTFLQQSAKWLERMSCNNQGLAIAMGVKNLSDNQMDDMLASIVNNEKSFKDVASEFNLKPADFKKRLIKAGRFPGILRAVATNVGRNPQNTGPNISAMARILGVDRAAVLNWLDDFGVGVSS